MAGADGTANVPRQSEKHSSAARREVKDGSSGFLCKTFQNAFQICVKLSRRHVSKGSVTKNCSERAAFGPCPETKRSGESSSGGGCGMLFGRGRVRALPANADKLGNARFLHRDAVKDAAHFHGLAIVRDDDELRLTTHIADEAGKAADVGFVKRRVDFVEDAER